MPGHGPNSQPFAPMGESSSAGALASQSMVPMGTSDAHPYGPMGSYSLGPSQGNYMMNLFNDRIVFIWVGPEAREFTVHEQLLCSHSNFFHRHFFAPVEEGKVRPNAMKLLDDNPKYFDLFVRWLYGTALSPLGRTSFRFDPPGDRNNVSVRDYLGVYVLGGKLGIPALRNAVIDVLYAYYGEASDDHESPNLHDVKYIFENTAEDAPMRRLLIAHALFFFFSKNRRNAPLPQDWVDVLSRHADVGFAMFTMLADWKWAMNVNAPRMAIRKRAEFHERIPVPQVPDIVKPEPTEENNVEEA
ncbi:hypothetical protein VTI74DRAFT_3264 [Chaetomium olivicolor]